LDTLLSIHLIIGAGEFDPGSGTLRQIIAPGALAQTAHSI
jgi:hypothetical protein